jgi:hypothetical protein
LLLVLVTVNTVLAWLGQGAIHSKRMLCCEAAALAVSTD